MKNGAVYLSGDVAREFHISRERINQYARSGRLQVFAVTVRGVRLFASVDVERFRAERERRRVGNRTNGARACR